MSVVYTRRVQLLRSYSSQLNAWLRRLSLVRRIWLMSDTVNRHPPTVRSMTERALSSS